MYGVNMNVNVNTEDLQYVWSTQNPAIFHVQTIPDHPRSLFHQFSVRVAFRDPMGLAHLVLPSFQVLPLPGTIQIWPIRVDYSIRSYPR